MTDQTIALTTPAQISMWVLLSRRGQIKLQMKGLNTPGLVKWCRANIDGCENARTVKQCIVPVEYAIATAGGPPDYTFVNLHLMERVSDTMFLDRGILPDEDALKADANLVYLHSTGLLEIVYTLDAPREPNNMAYEPA